MSRLVALTEEQRQGKAHGTPIAKAYGAKYINNLVDIAGDTTMEMNSKDSQDLRVITQSVAAAQALINTGVGLVGDNAVCFAISLTVIRLIGKSIGSSSGDTRSFLVHNIVEVEPDPDNSADSIVTVRDDNRLSDVQYVVDDTVAEILTLANA